MGLRLLWSGFWCLVMFTLLRPVEAQPLSIAFEGLVDFAVNRSAEARLIETSYDLARTKSNLDMQWTNPNISYSQEYAGGDREHYLTLDKRIEMPWVYSLRRKGWKIKAKAAEFEKQARLREYFQQIKSTYVELKLLERQEQSLLETEQVIEKMMEVTSHKFKEGVFSELEQQAIQMTMFNMQSKVIEIEQERRAVESDLKVKLSIDESREILLVTNITFHSVTLESADFYETRFTQAPGYQEWKMKIEAAEKRIGLAKRMRLLPSIEIFGGYKRVTPDEDGYVFGLSAPFPVFNWNQPQVDRQRQEMQIMKEGFNQFTLQVLQGINVTLDAVKRTGKYLESATGNVERGERFLEGLLIAFEEGQISISELLNSVQILLENIREYYLQLTEYYQNLFLLESASGLELVSFSRTGGQP